MSWLQLQLQILDELRCILLYILSHVFVVIVLPFIFKFRGDAKGR